MLEMIRVKYTHRGEGLGIFDFFPRKFPEKLKNLNVQIEIINFVDSLHSSLTTHWSTA